MQLRKLNRNDITQTLKGLVKEMKFKYYGYTEKKVEVRKMTMGAIALTIAQGLIKKNAKEIEIRIVDCFMGEVEAFNGLDDFLSKDWCSNWEVNVYDWAIMHDNRSNKDYLKVIIADEIEMMDSEGDE